MEQLYKVPSPCLDDHQFKKEELESVGELSKVCSRIVLKCLYLARIGRPDIFTVCQQTCKRSRKMDSDLRQRFGKIDFIHSSRKLLTSALSTDFISRLRLCGRPLRTLNKPWEESYVSSEVEHLSPSVGCARNKRQYPTVPQSLKSSRWMLDCAWVECLLSIFGTVVIEVLHSTNNTARQSKLAQGNLRTAGNHSPTVKRKREIEQLSNVDHVPTNTHSSQGEYQLYIFEDNEAVVKMIIKGRSPTMRHASRTHRVALDRLFDRINLDPKIQINFVDIKH